MFPLSRAIDRGDLRSAGIGRLIAKPLRLHWSPSLASASFGRLLSRWSTILGYYPNDLGCFHQGPLGAFSDARLVTPSSLSCSMLSETPGCRLALVHNAPSVSPAPLRKRSARSQNQCFSGLWVRFRAHTLHLARLAHFHIQREIHYRAVDYTLPGRACAFAFPRDAEPAPGSNP